MSSMYGLGGKIKINGIDVIKGMNFKQKQVKYQFQFRLNFESLILIKINLYYNILNELIIFILLVFYIFKYFHYFLLFISLIIIQFYSYICLIPYPILIIKLLYFPLFLQISIIYYRLTTKYHISMSTNSINFKYLNHHQLDYSHAAQNYAEEDEMAVDNQAFVHQELEINQEANNLKKIMTIGNASTKFTKTVTKGRPKKKERDVEETGDQILTQHQKTIFGLVLSFTFKSLKKDYKKYSKCGFLHKNIAPSSHFYLEIKEALKKNKIISQEYKNIIQIELQENVQFQNFLNKLLWIGPSCISDQLLYIVSHFLINFQSVISKFRNIESLKTGEMEQIKQVAKKFSQDEFDHFWKKLVYITFKTPRLKLLESNFEFIKLNFLQFIQVFIVSTILAIGNFLQNPYFSNYYSYDYQVEERIQKIKKKQKQIEQKKLSIQKQNQKVNAPVLNQNPEINQIPQYQAMNNCLQYIQFTQNFNQTILPTYNYNYGYNTTYPFYYM